MFALLSRAIRSAGMNGRSMRAYGVQWSDDDDDDNETIRDQQEICPLKTTDAAAKDHLRVGGDEK